MAYFESHLSYKGREATGNWSSHAGTSSSLMQRGNVEPAGIMNYKGKLTWTVDSQDQHGNLETSGSHLRP